MVSQSGYNQWYFDGSDRATLYITVSRTVMSRFESERNTAAKSRCVLPSFIAAATASAGLLPIELISDILHRQHRSDGWKVCFRDC